MKKSIFYFKEENDKISYFKGYALVQDNLYNILRMDYNIKGYNSLGYKGLYITTSIYRKREIQRYVISI